MRKKTIKPTCDICSQAVKKLCGNRFLLGVPVGMCLRCFSIWYDQGVVEMDKMRKAIYPNEDKKSFEAWEKRLVKNIQRRAALERKAEKSA